VSPRRVFDTAEARSDCNDMKPALLIAGLFIAGWAWTAFLMWAILKMLWNPLRAEFPAREPEPGAVERRFQSFKVGGLNLGCAVHAAADERFLHLTPLGALRVMGAGPVSIPWEAMEYEKRSKNGKWTWVRIGRRRVMGPSWCLGLANPGQEEADGASRG